MFVLSYNHTGVSKTILVYNTTVYFYYIINATFVIAIIIIIM